MQVNVEAQSYNQRGQWILNCLFAIFKRREATQSQLKSSYCAINDIETYTEVEEECLQLDAMLNNCLIRDYSLQRKNLNGFQLIYVFLWP